MRTGEIELPNDFVQAEFSNLDTEDDSGNPWKWKAGEKLHRWTTDKYYVIVRVKRYPDSTIVLRQVKE